MTVELINQTHYANMYGVKDGSWRIVGTVEVRLAGADCGTYFTAWATGYTKRDIRKEFNKYWKGA